MKIVFTGRMGTGKDYLADKVGFAKIGFADGIYLICDHFFGSHDKKIPGMRRIMQTVGVWGRGVFNAEYPATIERALFCERMQNSGGDIIPRSWQPTCDYGPIVCEFGKCDDIWVQILLHCVEYMDGVNVSVTNARFADELKTLINAGFEHYHVMCSDQTLEKRGWNRGLTEGANDITEQMAKDFDGQVISGCYNGNVVWNDELDRWSAFPANKSTKFYDTEQFVEAIKRASAV